MTTDKQHEAAFQKWAKTTDIDSDPYVAAEYAEEAFTAGYQAALSSEQVKALVGALGTAIKRLKYADALAITDDLEKVLTTFGDDDGR